MNPQGASEPLPLNNLYSQLQDIVGKDKDLRNLTESDTAKIAKECLLSLETTHGKITFKADKKPVWWGILHFIPKKFFGWETNKNYDFNAFIAQARIELDRIELDRPDPDAEKKETLRLILNKTIEHVIDSRKLKKKSIVLQQIPPQPPPREPRPNQPPLPPRDRPPSAPRPLPLAPKASVTPEKVYNAKAQNILKSLSDEPQVVDLFLRNLKTRNSLLRFTGTEVVPQEIKTNFATKADINIAESIIYEKIVELCTKETLTSSEEDQLTNMVSALQTHYESEITAISRGLISPAFYSISALAQKPVNKRSESEKILFLNEALAQQIHQIRFHPEKAERLQIEINKTLKAIESEAFKQIYALAKKEPNDRSETEQLIFSSPYLRNEILTIYNNPTSAPVLLEKINEVTALLQEKVEAEKLKGRVPPTFISLVRLQNISGKSRNLPELNEYILSSKEKIEAIKIINAAGAELQRFQNITSDAEKLEKDTELLQLFPFAKDLLEDIRKEQFFAQAHLKDPASRMKQLENIYNNYKSQIEALKAVQSKLAPVREDLKRALESTKPEDLRQTAQPAEAQTFRDTIAKAIVNTLLNRKELLNKRRKEYPEEFAGFITTLSSLITDEIKTKKLTDIAGREFRDKVLHVIDWPTKVDSMITRLQAKEDNNDSEWE